jgi:hypothetical protein
MPGEGAIQARYPSPLSGGSSINSQESKEDRVGFFAVAALLWLEGMHMAAKKAGTPRKSTAKVAADKVTVTLSGADRARAAKCLRETGKITLGVREVSVTKLSDLHNAWIIVN